MGKKLFWSRDQPVKWKYRFLRFGLGLGLELGLGLGLGLRLGLGLGLKFCRDLFVWPQHRKNHCHVTKFGRAI